MTNEQINITIRERDELMDALKRMVKANGEVCVMPTAEAREQNSALKEAQALIAKIKKRS